MNGPILPGEDLIQMRKWRANLTLFSLQCPSQLTSTASTSAKVLISFTPNITKAKVQHSTRLCRLLNTFQFKPSPSLRWETMTECGRDVYRAFCTKYDKPCEYDHVDYIIKEHTDYDENDACVQYFMEYCENETIEESSLINFNHGDFVNICMPYTRDLINFYDENEEELLIYVDQYCEAAGYTSRLQLCEGDNIEDPDDFKAALVNHGMTYLGGMLLQACSEAYD